MRTPIPIYLSLAFLPVIIATSPAPTPLTLPILNDLSHQHYLINLTVGTPPALYSVLLDTGSTDFWLPAWNSSGCAPNPCKPGTFKAEDSSTAVDTGIPFNISYGLEPGPGWLGEYYNESVGLGGVVVTNQTMATASVPSPITPSTFWGILGLGSRYTTSSFNSPWSPIFQQPNATYTPLWEHLFSSGLIPQRLFSIFLNRQASEYGTITFGGIEGADSGKYSGELKSVPVMLRGPLFVGWVVKLTSLSRTTTANTSTTYPSTTLLTPNNFTAKVTLDTGSPNTYLPSSLYSSIATPLSPTYHPNPEGNPTPYVSCSFRTHQPRTYFTFGFAPSSSTADSSGPRIQVPLEELILPFGQPQNLGEVRGEDGEELCYLGVIESPSEVFLLGATFLRSVYAVFSGEEGVWSVSFAQARYE